MPAPLPPALLDRVRLTRTYRRATSVYDRAVALRRDLRYAPDIVRARLRHGRPELVLRFAGGIGDDVMCTTLCRELRRRGVGPIWMLSRFADLFEHTGDVAAVLRWGRSYRPALRRAGWYVPNPRYFRFDAPNDQAVLLEPHRHIVSTMCRLVGIVGPITRRPYVTLLDAERAAGRVVPRQVAIQSSGLEAGTPMRNKQWLPERFQQVVDLLRDEFDVVQLGAPSDPPLDGVLDLRGKTSRRQTAAVLSRSLAFVGNVGFLMHLARAVECRSVIVYGGRERPDQSGYSCNENLYGDVPCSPCWYRNRCVGEHRCMTSIGADAVAAAVRRAAARHGTPLEEDADVIEPASPLGPPGPNGRPTMEVRTPFGPRQVEAALLGGATPGVPRRRG